METDRLLFPIASSLVKSDFWAPELRRVDVVRRTEIGPSQAEAKFGISVKSCSWAHRHAVTGDESVEPEIAKGVNISERELVDDILENRRRGERLLMGDNFGSTALWKRLKQVIWKTTYFEYEMSIPLLKRSFPTWKRHRENSSQEKSI